MPVEPTKVGRYTIKKRLDVSSFRFRNNVIELYCNRQISVIDRLNNIYMHINEQCKILDEEKNGYGARDQLLYALYSEVLDSC